MQTSAWNDDSSGKIDCTFYSLLISVDQAHAIGPLSAVHESNEDRMPNHHPPAFTTG